MAAQEVEEVGNETENTRLTDGGPSRGQWSRKDKLLVALNTLIKTGDSIEIYLPGVITQVIYQVSSLR